MPPAAESWRRRRHNRTLTLGSLFDGSGTCPLAAETVGIKPVWASEIEPYPIAVTKSHFPEMRHLGDITKMDGAEVEPVDIITFGSPCQNLSVAGNRAGLAGEKSSLFMEAVRIIREMRCATHGKYPQIAIWENVPGAFSSNKGEDFRVVLEELIKIAEPKAPEVPPADKNGWPYADVYVGDGWSLAYRVLDAQYGGVPQRRRRIYLVVDFAGRRAGDILFKRDGLRRYLAPGGETRKGTAGSAAGSTGADDCAKCFDARGNGDGKKLSAITGDRHAVCYGLQGSMIGRKDKNGPQGSGVNEDVSFTLDATDRHAVCYTKQKFGEYKISEAAATSAARDHKSGSGVVGYPATVRRLTPTECARLQGFPDWWAGIEDKSDFTDGEYRFWRDVRNTYAAVNGKSVREYTKPQMLSWYNKLHTDSAEYKMWGNGMAFPCVLYVMEGVKEEIQSE